MEASRDSLKGTGSVLVINTGGTIAMVNSELGNPLSPLTPARDWKEIEANFTTLRPEFLGVDTDYYQFDPLLDSSDIGFDDWKAMAEVVARNYDDYAGFVILHGTDTMSYTASALSFMLENLAKPVVLTGSQIPMINARSDALQNLVTSVQIAAGRQLGIPTIPEVCIFFQDRLLRGNRARKLSSTGYSGFDSPNYPPLAVAGEHIDINEKYVRPSPSPDQHFYVSTHLDSRVMVLEVFPGFDPNILRLVAEQSSSDSQAVRAIVLKTFGAGNVPSNTEFLDAIEYATSHGVIVVDVTQCPQGMVELGLYEASACLLSRGVISGSDMTPEAAVCKLSYLLGKGWPAAEVRRMAQLDTRGEQSVNIFRVEFPAATGADPVYSGTAVIPGEIDISRMQSVSLHLEYAYAEVEATDRESHPELLVFLNLPCADIELDSGHNNYAGVLPIRCAESPADLFLDLTAPVKKFVNPGQPLSLHIVSSDTTHVHWKRGAISIHTAVR